MRAAPAGLEARRKRNGPSRPGVVVSITRCVPSDNPVRQHDAIAAHLGRRSKGGRDGVRAIEHRGPAGGEPIGNRPTAVENCPAQPVVERFNHHATRVGHKPFRVRAHTVLSGHRTRHSETEVDPVRGDVERREGPGFLQQRRLRSHTADRGPSVVVGVGRPRKRIQLGMRRGPRAIDPHLHVGIGHVIKSQLHGAPGHIADEFAIVPDRVTIQIQGLHLRTIPRIDRCRSAVGEQIRQREFSQEVIGVGRRVKSVGIQQRQRIHMIRTAVVLPRIMNAGQTRARLIRSQGE